VNGALPHPRRPPVGGRGGEGRVGRPSVYSQLLRFLGEVLGVADYGTVRDAAEEVLDVLKARGRPSPSIWWWGCGCGCPDLTDHDVASTGGGPDCAWVWVWTPLWMSGPHRSGETWDRHVSNTGCQCANASMRQCANVRLLVSGFD